eukprot:714948-Hanusia_phi.AAC.2
MLAAGFRSRKVRDRTQGKSKPEDLEAERRNDASSKNKKLAVCMDVPASKVEYHTEDELPRVRVFGKQKDVCLPSLQLRISNVPFGGLGVFAKEKIKKGDWITEYGGEVIGCNEARRRRANGEDTHIRSIGRENLCIDSRVRGKWNWDYYVR